MVKKLNGHTTIKIEKGIPLPAKAGDGLSLALRAMEVGDSIVVAKIARQSIFTIAQKVGIKVATRASGQTVRAWRIE